MDATPLSNQAGSDAPLSEQTAAADAAAGAAARRAPESDVLDSDRAGGLIIRGGAMRMASYATAIGLSVLSTALLTRYLGRASFGMYTTVISLVSVISVVTDAGMSNLGTREYAVRVGADREGLLRDLLGLRVSLTAIGVICATAFAIAAGYEVPLLLGTVLAGLATVVLVFQHTLSIPLSANLRLGALAALEVTRQVLSVALIVALIVLGADVMLLLTVTLVVNLVLVPLTAVLVRGQISMRPQLRGRHWLALLRLTVAFSLATAVGTVYVYTAQILTSLVATPAQNGLFAVSFRVFIVSVGVPGLLVGSALPLLARAARDDQDRLAYAIRKIFEVTLILGVGAALAVLGGAQFIIGVLANHEYAAAAGVLQIQGLAMIASFLTAGWGFALISLERYRGLLAANAVALTVSCGLTLWLASSIGARGAALATVCGEFTLAAGTLIMLIRGRSRFRPPLAVVPKVALAAAPALALALLVPGLPSVARMLLAIAAYGLVILITRALPQELIDILPRHRAPAH